MWAVGGDNKTDFGLQAPARKHSKCHYANIMHCFAVYSNGFSTDEIMLRQEIIFCQSYTVKL